MNSTLTGATATYLAQVRAKLSDLPPAEREDVLDDVAGHLTEVAGEFETDPTAQQLEDRLGTPRQYADELRTAAGYPPREQPEVAGEEDKAAGNSLRWALIAGTAGPFIVLVGTLGGEPVWLVFGLLVLFGAACLGVRALRGNPPEVVLETRLGRRGADRIREGIAQVPANWRRELVTVGQPIWWALRGLVGGGGVFAMIGGGAATVAAALAGAVVSIWIGRKSQQDRRWLWYVVPLNIIAAAVVPVWLALSFAGGGSTLLGNYNYYRYGGGGQADSLVLPTGLSYDGSPLENIYPFDAQGKRLANIRLYNERGTPLSASMPSNSCEPTSGEHDNVFPRPVVTMVPNPETGEEVCKESTDLSFVAPGPMPTTPSVPTPSAGPTSKPLPTPTASKPTPRVTLTVSPTR